ncbi:MAG TPA: acyl-CoA desaturase, partial [Ktedonobacterales bacterium]
MVAQPQLVQQHAEADSASYADLKRLIKADRLLEKRPGRALARIIIVDALVVTAIAIFIIARGVFWLECLDALFLALVTTQLGFVGHDAGHRQPFGPTYFNDISGLVHGNLLIGMSFSWWLDKHNRHHSRPNEVDSDPDIDIPMLTFSPEDAANKRGVYRFISAHQALFFFPLLTLVALDLQKSSVLFLLQGKARYQKTEVVTLLVHYAAYFGLIFTFLPVWQGIAFVLIHKLASGLYLGSVFAPNHKGMLLTEHNCQMDFLRRQVLTARNVRAGLLTDEWYGGLNYQVEHHLFPTMPRGNLAQAQRIVRAYCAKHG